MDKPKSFLKKLAGFLFAPAMGIHMAGHMLKACFRAWAEIKALKNNAGYDKKKDFLDMAGRVDKLMEDTNKPFWTFMASMASAADCPDPGMGGGGSKSFWKRQKLIGIALIILASLIFFM